MNKRVLDRIGYMLVILLLFLSLLHHYLTVAKPVLPTSGFIVSPELYDGLSRPVLGIYAGESSDGFWLRYNQQIIPVHYRQKVSPPRYGQILVYGTFHKEGYIEAHQLHNYNYNYIIYLISFLTFLFVLVLFFSEWKMTGRGMVSREIERRKANHA